MVVVVTQSSSVLSVGSWVVVVGTMSVVDVVDPDDVEMNVVALVVVV